MKISPINFTKYNSKQTFQGVVGQPKTTKKEVLGGHLIVWKNITYHPFADETEEEEI